MMHVPIPLGSNSLSLPLSFSLLRAVLRRRRLILFSSPTTRFSSSILDRHFVEYSIE